MTGERCKSVVGKSNLSFVTFLISSESVAFNHRAIAWIQNAIAEEVTLHPVALRRFQRILGLAHSVQHILRGVRRPLQRRVRPNRSSHHGEWYNRWGFIYLRWVGQMSSAISAINHFLLVRRYCTELPHDVCVPKRRGGLRLETDCLKLPSWVVFRWLSRRNTVRSSLRQQFTLRRGESAVVSNCFPTVGLFLSRSWKQQKLFSLSRTSNKKVRVLTFRRPPFFPFIPFSRSFHAFQRI